MSARAAPEYFRGRDNVDLEAEINAVIALGRTARPTEINAAIAFLVSEEASCLTARTLDADGGMR